MSGFRPRFFIDDEPPSLQPGAAPDKGIEFTLSSTDSHHALRVLRIKSGDPCEVVVGAAVYAASVSRATQPVKVRIGDRLEGQAAGAFYRIQVGLVQGLTRPSLLDQVFEKGTEVGASFFILVPAAGSTRSSDLAKPSRLERWRRIVVEAAKQSKQSSVPTVELAESFEAARDRLTSGGMVSFALEPSASASLTEALEQSGYLPIGGADPVKGTVPVTDAGAASGGIALWVGPESGWSDDELEGFAAAGIGRVKMGQSVLRAETAGPVAVAVTRLVIGDW